MIETTKQYTCDQCGASVRVSRIEGTEAATDLPAGWVEVFVTSSWSMGIGPRFALARGRGPLEFCDVGCAENYIKEELLTAAQQVRCTVARALENQP